MTDPADMSVTQGGRSFVERFTGALMLDATVYEEVEHDATALGQAAGVVALGAVANAIGSVAGGSQGVIGAVLLAFFGWALGTTMVWLVGVKIMDHTSDFPELLRTLGFASAPQVLAILGIVPLVGWIALIAVSLLSIVAWVIATRQALDIATGRAVLVCVLAVGVQVMLALVLAMFGIGIGGAVS